MNILLKGRIHSDKHVDSTTNVKCYILGKECSLKLTNTEKGGENIIHYVSSGVVGYCKI